MASKKPSASVSTKASIQESPAQPTIPSRGSALVFVSHDNRDAELAEIFANLLTDVSAGTLKSFRSSDKKGSSGIEFGTEWYTAIMSQLDKATDVVALLTQHSTDRPWILYEAGVAKGKLDTNVLGVALGVPLEKVSTGPFGQFQNCGDDEDSLTKLVIQLLMRNPDAAPREEAIRVQVKVFLDKSKGLLAKGKKPSTTATEESSSAKLFEEVKAMVRELPERVEERVQSVTRRSPIRRVRRFHLKMIEELLYITNNYSKNQAPFGLLMLLSYFKDDFPWIYEIGLDLYHAIRSGDDITISTAQEEMAMVFEAIQHPAFREFLRPDDEETYFLLRRMPELISRLVDEPLLISRPRSRRRPPSPPGTIKDINK